MQKTYPKTFKTVMHISESHSVRTMEKKRTVSSKKEIENEKRKETKVWKKSRRVLFEIVSKNIFKVKYTVTTTNVPSIRTHFFVIPAAPVISILNVRKIKKYAEQLSDSFWNSKYSFLFLNQIYSQKNKDTTYSKVPF